VAGERLIRTTPEPLLDANILLRVCDRLHLASLQA